jgi:hypothetical protein
VAGVALAVAAIALAVRYVPITHRVVLGVAAGGGLTRTHPADISGYRRCSRSITS